MYDQGMNSYKVLDSPEICTKFVDDALCSEDLILSKEKALLLGGDL